VAAEKIISILGSGFDSAVLARVFPAIIWWGCTVLHFNTIPLLQKYIGK
jgi:hypothetical protein